MADEKQKEKVAPVASSGLTRYEAERTEDLEILHTAYKRMLSSHFVATLIMISILTLGLLLPYLLYEEGSPSIILAVILSGSLGAFCSALIRLYSFEKLPRALLASAPTKMENKHLIMYSFLPPLIGSVGAAVVYIAFAGNIIRGALFPEFAYKPAPENGICENFGCLFGSYGPKGAADYAKCIIWGFVAGFSERFVPDTLLKIQATKS